MITDAQVNFFDQIKNDKKEPLSKNKSKDLSTKYVIPVRFPHPFELYCFSKHQCIHNLVSCAQFKAFENT